MLDRVEPMRIRPRLLQQPVARAQRSLQRRDAARMLGVDREHQPVEKTPALRGRAVEQRVHRGDQPDHAQMVGEGGGGGDRFAVDAALARVARPSSPGGASMPVPSVASPSAPSTSARHRPGAVAFRERHLVERGAPQPAARVPGTRSPRSGWSCRRRSGRPAPPARRRCRSGRVVAAEIRQRQSADAGGGHGIRRVAGER